MCEIYTDGATSSNGYEGATGGWSFVVADDSNLLRTGHVENATNNICEMLAIINACKFAENSLYTEPIVIYSDSAYVINCYKQKWYKKWQLNGWINSKKQPVANKELWEQLIPYFENNKFDFVKVKGHADNKYNILADKLAVEAKFCT